MPRPFYITHIFPQTLGQPQGDGDRTIWLEHYTSKSVAENITLSNCLTNKSFSILFNVRYCCPIFAWPFALIYCPQITMTKPLCGQNFRQFIFRSLLYVVYLLTASIHITISPLIVIQIRLVFCGAPQLPAIISCGAAIIRHSLVLEWEDTLLLVCCNTSWRIGKILLIAITLLKSI